MDPRLQSLLFGAHSLKFVCVTVLDYFSAWMKAHDMRTRKPDHSGMTRRSANINTR